MRFIVALLGLIVMPVYAQAEKQYEQTDIVQIRILDKVTARSRTFDLDVGQTVSYGNLRIKPRSCHKASPLEDPESASFLQIWQVGLRGKREWIFSGWMFASSPSLSAMDHPVYDVWVLDCLQKAANSNNESTEIESLSEENETVSDDSNAADN